MPVSVYLGGPPKPQPQPAPQQPAPQPKTLHLPNKPKGK